jgi:hypothetical protein
MKYITLFFGCCLISGLIITQSGSVYADIINSSTILMKIYFEKDGRPYDRPVKFTVTCYGHNFSDKTMKNNISSSKEIFSFSGISQYYPYRYTENYYGRGLRIDYCVVEGEPETGEKFTIKYPDLLKSGVCSNTGDGKQVCDLRFDISKKIPLIEKSGVTRIVSPAYETRFLMALVMTIFIEVIVLLLFIRVFYKLEDRGYPEIIITGILASMITLPYIWFVLPVYIKYHVSGGELSAIIAEAGIYYWFLKLKFSRALLVSAAANIISFISGLILFS